MSAIMAQMDFGSRVKSSESSKFFWSKKIYSKAGGKRVKHIVLLS